LTLSDTQASNFTMLDKDFFVVAWNNVCWHLWMEPDIRLIECLILQIVTLITMVMSVSSLCTIIAYIRMHKHVLCHWTIRFSIGVLILSVMLGVASFILLIYQQNGRHFDYEHTECKVVTIVIAVFSIIFIPIQGISIMAYRRWNSLIDDAGIREMKNVKWFEVQTFDDGANIDLRQLVAVKHAEELEKALQSESEQKRSSDPDQEDTAKEEEEDNPKKMEVVLTAHKSRYKLHFLSLIAQIVLFVTVQIKNYNEEQEKLLKWGYRFSRVIDEDDYFIAKWELENGIRDESEVKESFETLDWLEYVARGSLA